MKTRLLSTTLLLLATAILPLAAQPDGNAPENPVSNAERARPSMYRDKYESKPRYPYLLSVPSIGRSDGWFLNSNTIDEPASSRLAQNESSIAISPLDSNFLIASAVDFRTGAQVYLSYDGGRSWTNKGLGVVHPDWQTGNDPSVGFDHLGNAYVMYGAFPDNRTLKASGVYVAKSTDKGETWQAHITIIEHGVNATADTAFEDKYYIQIDNSPASPYRGWVYTPWKRVIDRDSSTQIVFTRSTDGGLTWTVPIPISPRKPGTSLDTTFGQSFPLVTTGPNGEIYAVWNDGPIRSIGYAKSTDGGSTFSEPRSIVQGYPTLGTARMVSGSVYHVLKGTFRAETYPTIMVDNSNSHRRGWVYLAWAAGLYPKVYFKRSTDGGATWSQEKMIHSDTTNDKWWPWLSVDQTTGDIAVMYADSRRDPANILIDQYVSYSSDGGDTWIDRRATDAVSDYRLNPFVGNIFAGDYSGNAFHSGKIYPSFLDTRNNGDNDVYTAVISIFKPYPVENLVVRGDFNAIDRAILSWTNPPMETIFRKPISEYSLVLYRDDLPIATLPSGTTSYADQVTDSTREYWYSVRVVAAQDTSVPVEVRFRPVDMRNPGAPVLAEVRDYRPAVELLVAVPGVRADSTTPLGNLKGYRLYRDGSLLKEVDLPAGDTGKTITITDQPTERGYYRYALTILDSAGNESLPTDTVLIYAGATTPYTENFDGSMPRFIIPSTWGTTSTAALSAPNSFTDSPVGDYKSRLDDVMQIFPVAMTGPVELTFAQIAIVDPGDSAIVEVSYDRGGTWTKVASYNTGSHTAWSDNRADAGDWREERIVLTHPAPGPDAFGVVRFRLKSGTFREADGWYIDNIGFGTTAGVALTALPSLGLQATAYPNPFTTAAIIGVRLERPTTAIVRVVDMLGGSVAVLHEGRLEAGDHSFTLDGTALPSGSYLYEVKTGSGSVRGHLLLAR